MIVYKYEIVLKNGDRFIDTITAFNEWTAKNNILKKYNAKRAYLLTMDNNR